MAPIDLPVDNLYKFAALSGVALIGFLLWLTWRTQRDIQSALLEITVKNAKSSEGVRWLVDLEGVSSRKTTQQSERLEKLKALRNTGRATETDLQMAKELMVEMKESEQDNDARLKEQHIVRESQEELKALVEGLNRQIQVFNNMRRKYTIATWAGILWSIAGFGLWYWKLQMPLDEKLRLEADVATIELQTKKAGLQVSTPTGPTSLPERK